MALVNISRRIGRRVANVALMLLVAAAGLISTPAPVAAAAHAVPWRFTTVTTTGSLGGLTQKDFFLNCPSGYIPVSGGVVGGSVADVLQIWEDWPDATDGTYHLLLANTSFSTTTTVTVAVNCVWLADVGTIYYRIGTFSRNSNGYAGGYTYCGSGLTVLSAGVAWSVGGARHVYFSSPITGGTQYGTGWYAAGWIQTSGATLGVELRCVSSSLLTAEYAEAQDTGAGPANGGVTATCTVSGYRVLVGGSAPPADQQNPGVNQGFSTSGPSDYRHYVSFGRHESGVILRTLMLCVPWSTVSVSITNQPPALSASSDGSVTFNAADSAGETITLHCTLDGTTVGCANNVANLYSVVDGPHSFIVQVQNQYNSFASKLAQWSVDTHAPTIQSHSPTSDLPIGGPMTINFSEAVTGLSTSSVTVHDDTTNVDVAGTVGTPTASTATWTPTAALTPGDTYRFSFTSAIHDAAGNPLTATFFTVNAAPDTTAPTIQSHAPTSGLAITGPLTITFSEPVSGVDGTSLTVHAIGANVDVAGVVARPTSSTATWTPSTRLVPGETYRFSFTTAIHDASANPLAATSFDVRAAASVENTSAAFLEYWDRDASSLANGGSYISSSLSGSKADLTFTATAGQTVAIYGIRTSSGGYADVYLDGVRKATASFYAASTGRARVYLSAALTAGTHTISIRPLGTKPTASTGTWVGVDNALVGSTVKQESSFKQAFRRSSSASASGGSYDTMIHKIDSDTNVPKIEVTLVGTGVKVYATKTTSSGSARIYVDGVLKATVSLHASATVYQALVYSGTFALGQHVIRVAAVGTSTGSTSSVSVDRISAI